MNKIILIFCIILTTIVSKANDFKIKTKKPFKKALTESATPLVQWLTSINETDFDLLCLGESHNKYFRDFYSTKVLPFLNLNALAIESLDDFVDSALENYVLMKAVPELLGAPFYQVIDSVFKKNENIQFHGVEVTQSEKKEINDAQLEFILSKDKFENIVARDSFIAKKINSLFEEGVNKVAALYGSKHCANYSTKGFGKNVPFLRLLKNYYSPKEKNLIAVRVVPPTALHHPLKLKLKEFNLLSEDMVIENGSKIDPKVYNYDLALFNLFKTYDVIIIPKS